MSFEAILNHVALVVNSVEKSAEKLRKQNFFIGPLEKWEGEGTLEIYVGDPHWRARLLLMEPYKEGAYQRALSKRGPGLHHIAIDVNDLSAYVASLMKAGWSLHPESTKSIPQQKTAWLFQPGVGTLIEAQQREGHAETIQVPQFISKIDVPVSAERGSSFF